MKRISFAAVLACGMFIAAPSVASAASDEKVTLTGCVVKGQEGGFLLTSVVDTSIASSTKTEPVGTSGAATSRTTTTTTTTVTRPSQVLYWLDDDDELEGMSGQKVEIKGELEGEIEKGELEIERKDNGMIELEAKFGGEKVIAMLTSVPAAVGTTGAVDDKEIEIDYIVRKVDVKSVKKIADSCQ